MKLSPTIIIDSREQNPWTFRNLASERGSLNTGDYSVRGLEHLISIERKSLDDLLACIGRERDRFKRELQRLRAYRFRCLVVEASYADLEDGRWRSKIKPAAVLGSLAGSILVAGHVGWHARGRRRVLREILVSSCAVHRAGKQSNWL